MHERGRTGRRRDHDQRPFLGAGRCPGLRLVRHDGDDDLVGGHWRTAFDVLDHAQFVLPRAERRILCDDNPFAVCIGLALGNLLAAIEQDDLGARLGAPGDHGAAVRPDPGNVEAGARHLGRFCLRRRSQDRLGWHRRRRRGGGWLGCLAESGQLA